MESAGEGGSTPSEARNPCTIESAPDAERDPTGKFLKNALPSYIIKEGPIWDLCKKLSPDFDFDQVTVNRFVDSKQCQWHLDKNNNGTSRWAMMGDCTGGALTLGDGRRFSQKRRWYEYDGAKTAHAVEPFVGERLTVVLYKTSDAVNMVSDGVVDAAVRRYPGRCPCDCVEPILAVKKSYRNVGKKEKQEELQALQSSKDTMLKQVNLEWQGKVEQLCAEQRNVLYRLEQEKQQLQQRVVQEKEQAVESMQREKEAALELHMQRKSHKGGVRSTSLDRFQSKNMAGKLRKVNRLYDDY